MAIEIKPAKPAAMTCNKGRVAATVAASGNSNDGWQQAISSNQRQKKQPAMVRAVVTMNLDFF